MFSGIGVIVDRDAGAQRELLTAPLSRALLVLANLILEFGITALQIGALLAVARGGIHFNVTSTGLGWFVGAAALFTIGMDGVAEVLAARLPHTEEYIARVPAIGIVPWSFAGSLFPITALPTFVTWLARSCRSRTLFSRATCQPGLPGRCSPSTPGSLEADCYRVVQRTRPAAKSNEVKAPANAAGALAPSAACRSQRCVRNLLFGLVPYRNR